MRSRGSVSWWCDCPGTKADCARPRERNHRTWYFAIRLDTTEGDNVQVKRGGFPNQDQATAALEHVRALIAVAESDERVRRGIASTLIERSRRGGDLPSVEEVRQRYGVGLDPVAPSMSLGEWLDEWLISKRRVADTTRERYGSRVASVWKPHLGDVPLDRLRGAHVAGVLDWIDRRNETIREAREAGTPVPSDPLDGRFWPTHISQRTQAQIVGVLSMALNAAIRRRLLTFNPCREVELPSLGRSRVARVWGPDQVASFITSTAERRLGPLYRLVLLRGLRRGEVCGLQWRDVDLDARRVEIKRSMRFAGPRRGVGLGLPKTDAGTRTVSLDAGTADILRKLKARQRQERLAAGAAWRGAQSPDQDWVFARPDGFPTPPSEVSATFKVFARELDLPLIRFHDGRHTAATLGLEAGLDVKIVSDQLGHSSTRITQDLYTHVRRARHDAAAELIENLVFGGTAEEQTSANEQRRG